ncbi:DEAD/DEAH box helicase [Methylobacterium sp. J-001]|uniref:DEAD/DEAH box helicase n=1 Tax=Methylobacterium sp. J-001 TaxID=2836609 RepID=UPI001FBB506D|nr:DEAD/DEAH box helicase [Methylobacterium sp. J-001]MCJ2119989.1 DEAD/DEAH box helicase [Methylobacterium sp. J-001]
MLPSILARQVRNGVEDQLRATFAPSSPGFHDLIERFVGERDSLVKGPWLSLDMPFRRSGRVGEFFPAISMGFKPYKHQELAFQRLSSDRPRSTLVATGTGSGKTECFLLPILDACRKARSEGGIKAIFVYPMNALAADQARRIARLIAKTPGLKGLRVGLYADERSKHPTNGMTDHSVIDDRTTLIGNPPDILLTNYKMLDYMLVRPDERSIWGGEGKPAPLRYLVVDELHTFDGAQGTDLASLVRRLKARLAISRGDLCCVGTSATLGGPEAVDDLIAYAAEIFDEPFDKDSIVLEDRHSVMEYLQPLQVEYFDVPTEADARSVVEAIDDILPDELVRRAFRLWFDQPPGDLSEIDGRFALGRMIDANLFFQNLLKVMKGRPTSYTTLREELRGNRLYRVFTDIHLDALLDTLTALIAHARRADPDVWDEHGRPMALPFFNVRNQLWLREMRRMVATVEASPWLRHHDDLGQDEQRRALPVIHCRGCGGAGWATVMPADERRALCAEPKDVYQAYFGYSDRLRFLLPEEPVPRTKRKLSKQTLGAWLCTRCLVPHYDGKPEKGCSSCKAEPTSLIELFVHKPGHLADERFRVDHDCPFCGSPSGMGILGAQSVTMVSGMVGTLFASDHNDDPKILTFSDSVQDAAHRGAVLQARNASSVFRAALSRFVCEEVVADLGTVSGRAPDAMKAALGPGADDADFVATYLPPDMEWRDDYRKLLGADELPARSKLPDYLRERLAWDTFAELTFRSRLGATVERLGIVATHVSVEAIERVVNEFGLRMPEALGSAADAIEPRDIVHFVVGVLDHMRARGAVVTDVTRIYVGHEARWFAVTKGHPSGKSLPQYAPASPKPVFPSNRILKGFETVASDGVGGWYVPWFHKCFDHALTLTGTLFRDAYQLLFRIMERQGIAERVTVGLGRDPVTNAAWGLLPEAIQVHTDTQQVRCDACGSDHNVPTSATVSWVGMPCTRVGCNGSLELAENGARTAIRTRVMTRGRVKRVLSAEHTSLLDREERQRVEERFMSATPRTWYPNLLSATPTLEMGINIGDLSTLILCSVPPEQQNYVQRIGRTGRRDGNSLNVTVANGRPHDMWYWTDPQEMISGKVRTPGVHLKAVAILKRQFAAYTLDCWVKEGAASKGYGKIGGALAAIQTGDRASFPLSWFEYLAGSGKAEALFDGFCGLFPRIRDDSETAETLRAFAVGGEDAGLTHLVASEYVDAGKEIASVLKRVNDCGNLIKRLGAMVPPPLDVDQQVDALKAERSALRRIKQGIEQGDNLGFLTDRGILPNYAFPEQGVTLKSVLYRSEPSDDANNEPAVTEYMRPAAAALSDFAPNAVFYAQGRKMRIDQIDLSASPVEQWRVCPECTHIELDQVGTTEAPCPCCASPMWADTGSRRPMIRLKQVLAIGSDRKSRIGDDADERDRHYFDRDYLPAFERDQVGDAYAIDNGEAPFAYEHLRRCTFREVNFGERGDAPTGQKVAGEKRYGHGFSICRSCGKVQAGDEFWKRKREGSKLGVHVPRC